MPVQHFPPPPGTQWPPLSYAAKVGDLLFVSGIPGYDAERQLSPDFDVQFGFVVSTISKILQQAGTDLSRLVKVNVLLTRAADVARMNVLYVEAFGPPPYPARTTCVVQALPDPDMLIEIECVASLAP